MKASMVVACCTLLAALTVQAQLVLSVSPLQVAGSKMLVPLTINNCFTNRIESVRAICFLLDEQGKMVGQASRWVVGGAGDNPRLAPGATNVFNFVVTAAKPTAGTNLAARISVNRIVLEGGTLVNVQKDVQVHYVGK